MGNPRIVAIINQADLDREVGVTAIIEKVVTNSIITTIDTVLIQDVMGVTGITILMLCAIIANVKGTFVRTAVC